VVPQKQYRSILQLLTIFAQHLSALSNQLVVQEVALESPAISRARSFITEHHGEEMTLTGVARAVNMSAFYFCKTFRKATGLTFTDYVARVRVEKVKDLLLNPNKRVSEAAYEAGFQSLSQFNRVFRRIAGEPPSAYRDKLQTASPA
jgi:AraC-like DNA-binding protein